MKKEKAGEAQEGGGRTGHEWRGPTGGARAVRQLLLGPALERPLNSSVNSASSGRLFRFSQAAPRDPVTKAFSQRKAGTGTGPR